MTNNELSIGSTGYLASYTYGKMTKVATVTVVRVGKRDYTLSNGERVRIDTLTNNPNGSPHHTRLFTNPDDPELARERARVLASGYRDQAIDAINKLSLTSTDEQFAAAINAIEKIQKQARIYQQAS